MLERPVRMECGGCVGDVDMPVGLPRLPRHLAAALSALALVTSLAVYQRSVLANPLSVAQDHWQAIAAEDQPDTLARYSAQATLDWSQGPHPGHYSGPAIATAWQVFFDHHQIQQVQVLRQEAQDLTVEATLLLTLNDAQGQISQLPVLCTLQLDQSGQIQYESWQVLRPPV